MSFKTPSFKKKEKKKALSRLEPWAMGSGYVTSHCGRPPSVQRASLSVLIFFISPGRKKKRFPSAARVQLGHDVTQPAPLCPGDTLVLCSAFPCDAAQQKSV